MSEFLHYDTWVKVGGTYKCGCCGRIPTFVDISEIVICPHCDHRMRAYETEDGFMEIPKARQQENPHIWAHDF